VAENEPLVKFVRGIPDPFMLRWLIRNRRDSLVVIITAGAITAIFINGLLLQPGPHPAPIFSVRPLPIASNETTGAIVATLPRPRRAGAEGGAPALVPRTRGEIIADMQRELARRGFYDGPVDGIDGAKTNAAIRDFEQAAGLRPSVEPTEALLQAIARSAVKASAVGHGSAQKEDAIAGVLNSTRQVIAIQRALSDYGYGPLKPTGVYDPDTRAAIERFERDRKLPVTGQISERMTRELVALIGHPLE
jgi:peptidoglycan hydrolase-like protein with peptidoglycan-binding domain